MIVRSKWVLGTVLLLLLAATGCGHSPMDADRAIIRRWAEEMDRDASQLREHVATMRQLAPEHWHTRVDEHASLLTRTLDRMDQRMAEMRHMGEMGMGMGMGGVGMVMGMSTARHQEMIDLMETLRDDLQQLGVAAPAEVMERMPAHLDRLEEMVRMMGEAAAHMQSSGGMGGMR